MCLLLVQSRQIWSRLTKNRRFQELEVSKRFKIWISLKGLKKEQAKLTKVDEDLKEMNETTGHEVKIVGKNYFRNPDVNQGFYSKKLKYPLVLHIS